MKVIFNRTIKCDFWLLLNFKGQSQVIWFICALKNSTLITCHRSKKKKRTNFYSVNMRILVLFFADICSHRSHDDMEVDHWLI